MANELRKDEDANELRRRDALEVERRTARCATDELPEADLEE